MFPQSIGMRTLCVFVFCLAFALIDAAAKQRHCTFRVHAQANPQDTDVFSMPARATSSGKDVAIEKTPWITEHDVKAFAPYPAQNGTFGALFQLDEHGAVVLDTLSVERRGRFLFVFINGRMITELQIDKRVSDGKLYIPSGLSAADVELMKKQWRSPGKRKR
jgi:hypothetical protein